MKKWTLRLITTALIIVILLLIIILNPILTYANKTTYHNYTIFHGTTLNPALLNRLDEATELLRTSQLYNPSLQPDICLNDGSAYPKIIAALRAPAFAWGFYNKVVLQGNADCSNNYVAVNGYRWNMTQLLAHELTHCLQFNQLGLWRSNPFADIPEWKWEGYAEYVSRQNNGQRDLLKNISRLVATDKNSWAIAFKDSTITPAVYYGYWILVQYCLDIKKMNYRQVLADTTSEESLKKQMMQWFGKQQ